MRCVSDARGVPADEEPGRANLTDFTWGGVDAVTDDDAFVAEFVATQPEFQKLINATKDPPTQAISAADVLAEMNATKDPPTQAISAADVLAETRAEIGTDDGGEAGEAKESMASDGETPSVGGTPSDGGTPCDEDTLDDELLGEALAKHNWQVTGNSEDEAVLSECQMAIAWLVNKYGHHCDARPFACVERSLALWASDPSLWPNLWPVSVVRDHALGGSAQEDEFESWLQRQEHLPPVPETWYSDDFKAHMASSGKSVRALWERKRANKLEQLMCNARRSEKNR